MVWFFLLDLDLALGLVGLGCVLGRACLLEVGAGSERRWRGNDRASCRVVSCRGAML